MASSSQTIDVPADGLCFYHCVGHILRDRSFVFGRADAVALRTEICRILVDMGFGEEADRLLLEGSDGYPGELAFVAAARILAGVMEVVTLDGKLLSYGSGAVRLRIVQTLVYDGAGHGSPHFQISAMDYAAHSGAMTTGDAIRSALDAAYDQLGVGLRVVVWFVLRYEAGVISGFALASREWWRSGGLRLGGPGIGW